jgi:hypothetical protein
MSAASPRRLAMGLTTALLAAGASACTSGHDRAAPAPSASTTTASTVPVTAPGSTTTTAPAARGTPVNMGDYRYDVTLTGPILVNSVASRSLPPGLSAITFSLVVSDPGATAEPLAPFHQVGISGGVVLGYTPGSTFGTCGVASAGGSGPSLCPLGGLALEDDPVADTGATTIQPGQSDTITYEDSNPVPSSSTVSDLRVTVGGTVLGG